MFIDGVVWVGCDVGWVQVVFVQVWQIYYEGVFELVVYCFLYVVEVLIFGVFFKFVVEDFFLVWIVGDFVYLLVGDQ